jgi:hypothetical protein
VLRLALACVALLALPATARAVPVPEDDPFFRVPPHLKHVANGTVLAQREIDASAGGVPLPADSWQVKYKTLDNQGRPTATVLTVMVPTAPYTGTGKRPLISYQTAEDGVGGKCSPSYALTAGAAAGSSNSEGETSAMAYILTAGYAVVAPDYEGPNSAFLGAKGEARAVLDGIRAAHRFRPAGLRKAPAGMIGYSGGAFATSIAGQIQPRYAKDVKLAGIALGGVPADVKETTRSFDDLGAVGAIVVGMIGIDRAYPRAHLEQLLNAKGKQLYKDAQRDCIGDGIGRAPGQHITDIEAKPGTFDLPHVTKLLRRISPLGVKGVPSAPVYDYHAVNDELAPIGPDRELVKRYCRDGVEVQHVEDSASEHISYLVTGLPGAISYFGDRFAGRPAPSTC